jgi:sodium-dependent phosphate cotransporter
MGLGRGVTVIVMSGIGLVGLFISLIFISKVMRTVIAGASENVLRRAVGANIYLALIIGAVLTATVQSSSITTSLMVPLVGTGILQIAHVYPLMLGANMGTTVTATLVALGSVTRKEEFRRAFAAATVHDFFNVLTVLHSLDPLSGGDVDVPQHHRILEGARLPGSGSR